MNNEVRNAGLKPYQGIIEAILGILMLIFIAAPVQRSLGMTGLALTEIMVLLLAVISALLLKGDLGVIFSVRIPKLRQIAGTLVIWIGTYIGIMAITLIIGYIFPESLNSTSSAIGTLITSVPPALAFFIIAVMPAICEEALMRGFILSSFRSFKSRWTIVVLVGIIFGIFHLDFVRFFPTAILGMALAYIMLETENLLLPMLLHFVNNAFAAFAAFLAGSSGASAAAAESLNIPLISVGVYLVIASAVPFIILAGAYLIKDRSKEIENTRKKKSIAVYVAAATTVILLVSGILIVSFSMEDANEIKNTEFHVQYSERSVG